VKKEEQWHATIEALLALFAHKNIMI